MAIPNFLEGAAFGVLNDILAGYRDNNGFAQPNKYEVLIFPPAKLGGGQNQNVFGGMERQSDLRKISLRVITCSASPAAGMYSSLAAWWHV